MKKIFTLLLSFVLLLSFTGNKIQAESVNTLQIDGSNEYLAKVNNAAFNFAGKHSTSNYPFSPVVFAVPVITCPGNINTTNTAGLCSKVVTYTVTATNSPTSTSYSFVGATVGSGSGSFGSGQSFNIGATTVTVSATNASGTATCSFIVTVTDNEKPVITCQPNITVNVTPGRCDAVVAVTSPSVSDNCSQLLQGNALNFDGVNDIAFVNSTSVINTANQTARTVEVYFKVNDKNISSQKQVIWEEGAQSNGLNIYVYNGELYMGIYSITQGWSPAGNWIHTPNIQSGQWHNAVLVFDGNAANVNDRLKGYLDGQLFGSSSTGGNTLNSHSGANAVGAAYNNSYFHDGPVATNYSDFFGGDIDEIRLWTVARTAAQLAATNTTKLLGTEPGLVVYYDFDQGTACGDNSAITILQDRTSTGLNGTLQGFNLGGATCTSNFTNGSPAITSDLSLTNSKTGNSDASGTYPVGVTTLTWTAKDLTGNTSTCTQKVTVVNNNVASITASGPTTFCSGGSVTLTASAGTSYLWSTGAVTQSITTSTAGSYTVTVTYTSGCSAVSTPTTVTVNASPVLSAILGATTLCANTSSQLNVLGASGGTVSFAGGYEIHTFTNGGTFTPFFNGNVEVLVVAGGGSGGGTSGPTSGGHYQGGGGGAGGVLQSVNYSVNQNTGVPVTIGAGGASIITGNGLNGQNSVFGTLNAIGGGGGGQYGSLGNAGGSGGGNGRDNNATPAQGTAGQGNAGGNGDSGGGGGAGGAAPNWNGGPGISSSISGVATFYAGGGGGSTTSSAGGSGGVGGGGAGANSFSFGTSGTNGTPNTGGGGGAAGVGKTTGAGGSGIVIVRFIQPISTFTWSSSNTSVANISTTGLVTPESAGNTTITYVGTNAAGCSASVSSTVTVNPVPSATITAGGPTTFCSGGSVTLSAPAGNTYLWSTGATTQSITTSVSGSYTVTVTSGSCFATSTPTVVTVTPLNTIATGSNQTVCINSAISNITMATTGATGATFSGLPAGVTGSWSGNVVTIGGTPNASGTFNYTVTTTGGCPPATATGTITVTPLNTIAAGSNRTVCINSAITNITMATTGATGATFSGLPSGVTGSWSGNVATISGTPTVPGTFNYTVTTTGGCPPATATGTITVTPLNTIAAGSNQTVCVNSAITNITMATTGATGATFSGLPAGVTGSWSANVVTISGTPLVSGTFNYTVTTTGGCPPATATGTITVNSLPVVAASSNSPVNAFSSLNLSASGANTYSWTGPNAFSATGATPSITSVSSANAGVYTVIGTNITTGCTNTATTNVVISFVAATGLNLDGTNDYVSVPDNNKLDFGSGNFTIETWVNKKALTNSFANSFVVGKWNTGATAGTNEWDLATSTTTLNNIPMFLMESGTTIYQCNGTTEMLQNTWYHLAVVRNGTSLKLYVNGLLEGSITIPANAAINNTGLNMTIGAFRLASSPIYSNINIDELRLWNRALCQAEIQNNKDCELNPAGQTNLIALYHFNQGQAGGSNSGLTSLTDATVNGLNGTLNNFALSGNTSNWTLGNASGNCTPFVPTTTPITGITTVCLGSSSTLTNTTSGGVWSSSNPSVATVDANGVVSSLSAGTTVISYTNVCGGVSTITITVNALPNPVISASGPTTFCANSSVNLSVQGGGAGNALTFGGNKYVDIPHNALLNVGTSTDFTYEAWVKLAGSQGNFAGVVIKGTGGPFSQLVIVNNHIASEIFNTSLVSAQGTTNLADNAWHHLAMVVSRASNTCKLYVDGVQEASVTNAIIGTNLDNPSNMLIGVERTKGIYFNGSIDEVRVWNTARTQTELQSSRGNIIPANTAGLVAYYKLDEGTGTIAGDATANGLNGTLVNSPVWLVPSTAPIAGFTNLSWSNGATTSSISPVTSGNYTVTVTNSFGCTATSAATAITVNPVPTVNAVANQEVCHNGVATTAISFSGAVSGTVFNWTNNTPSIGLAASGTGDIASFLGQNLGNTPVTATITVTPSANGCNGTPITFTIRVNPIPTFNAIANQTVCEGMPTTAVTFVSAVAGTTYQWSGGAAIGLANGSGTTLPSFNAINGTGSPVTANILVISKYQGSSIFCGTSRLFTITVNPTSVATITAGGSTTFCSGGSVTLTASNGSSYLWSNGATTQSISASTAGSYTVTVTNASNCSATSAATVVIVNPLPTISGVSGNIAICSGSTTTLTASSAATSPVYKWYDASNTLLFTGAAFTTPSLTSNTTYSVAVTNGSGCTSTLTSVTVGVTNINNQTVSVSPTAICGSGSSTVTVGSSQLGVNYILQNNATGATIAGPIAGTGSAINFSTGNITTSTTYKVIGTTQSNSGALSFDGVNDNVDIAIDLNENAYTAELWFKTTDGNCGIMMHDGVTNGTGGGHDRHIYLNNGNVMVRLWVNETIGTSGTNYADGNWHHVAYTFGGSVGGQRIYVDGVLKVTGSLSQSSWNGNSVNLGISFDAIHQYFNGQMDDVRIYNIARTQAEIQGDMNNTLVGNESGLQAYYTFENGPGSSTVTDITGHGFTGTLLNMDVNTAWSSRAVTSGSIPSCTVQMLATPTVTVNPLPTATVSGTSTVCQNAATQIITFTGANGTSPYTFTYTINGGAQQTITSIGNTATISVPTATAGTFTYALVSVKDASSTTCTNTATGSAVVTVNALPIPTITAGSATTFCTGSSVTLTASAGSSYLWSNGATTQSIIVNTSGSFTVKVTNASGCFATSAATVVTVNPTPIVSIAGSACLDGSAINVTSTNTSQIQWSLNGTPFNVPTSISPNGVIVAGGNGQGSGLNQLQGIQDVILDASGNVYVSEQTNNRVVKWAPGATTGVVVAGGNGGGGDANQLNNPNSIILDAAGNIYVSDYFNHRVQKWAPGATSGVTVAGGNGKGTALNQTPWPAGIALDAAGNLFVMEGGESPALPPVRVTKWAPGATSGVVVVSSTFGSGASQFQYGDRMVMDNAGNLYIGDYANNRVQKWAQGASSGTTVAGGNGQGSDPNQTSGIVGLRIDASNNLYILNSFASPRISKWAPGATSGVDLLTSVGLHASTSFYGYGFDIDAAGSLYIADELTSRVMKFTSSSAASYTPTAPGTYSVVVTSPAGCTASSNTVVVNALPTFTSVPANPVVNSATGLCTAVVSYNATVSGVPTPSINYTFSGATTGSGSGTGSGQTFNTGITTVTLTATNTCATISTTFTVTVNDVQAPVFNGTAVGSAVVPANILANVPEASQYRTVYQLSIPNSAGWNSQSQVPYSVNNATVLAGSPFNRIAYYVELDNNKWVWVSMDKFTSDLTQIGIPTGSIIWQQKLNNMNVVASANAGVVTGNNITTGNIEFWSGCYNESNGFSIPGASNSTFDFGDQFGGVNCYGSFQIHNYGAAQTLFAYNRWAGGGTSDLGIGNNTGNVNPDWTFMSNASNYTIKNIYVFISGGVQNLTANTDPGQCSAVVTVTAPIATDNCGTPVITGVRSDNQALSAAYPKGITTITWTATDASGNTATLNQTVTVTDNQAPTISCTANITTNATSAAGAVVNYTAPVGTDNCPGVNSVRTLGLASGATFPIGTTTVTHVVTDAGGLTATCSFTVTVIGLAPQIVCPANITVNATAGQCGTNVSFAATETTAIPASMITYSVASGSFFAVGTTTVAATATNAVGTSSCSFTVTVKDATPPTIVCAADITINTTPGLCTGTTTLAAPTVTDNCTSGAGNALNFTGSGGVSGSTTGFPIGNASRTIEVWTKGNSVVGFGTIFGYGSLANTGTIFTLGIHAVGKAYFWGNSADVIGTSNIMDGQWHHLAVTYNGTTIKLYVDGNLESSGSVSLNTPSNSTFYMGYQPLNGWAYNGTVDEVRVWNIERTQGQIQASMASEIGAQSGLLALFHLNQGVAGGNNTGLTSVIDASGNNYNGTINGMALNGPTSNWVVGKTFGPLVTNNAPTVYPLGTTTVTWTATDAAGNTSTCSQNVTVVDNTPPTITGPSNITTTATSAAGAVVTYTTPVGTDNCSGATTVLTTGLASGSTFPIGVTTVIYTVTDGAGLTAQTSFTVTVSGLAPQITCPANITVNATAGLCGASVSFAASETVGIPASVITYKENTVTVTPGSFFSVGTHTITATATNAVGSSSCNFTITVVDNQSPVLVGVPADVTVECDAVPAAAVVTATDNCSTSVPSFTETRINGSCSGNYTLTRVWSTTDASNNTTTATQIITVRDTKAPVITCPSNISVPAANGLCTAVVNYVATATDNCSTPVINYSIAPGSVFNVGTQTVVVTATDACGNQSTCSFTVTVTDTQVPIVITQNITVNLDANGQASITPADINNGSTDNCGIATMTLDKSTFDCSNVTLPGGNSVLAYSGSTSNGIQNWFGTLGMDFDVLSSSGITISKLGAFDDGQNGILGSLPGGSIRVAIFNLNTQLIVPGLDVSIAGTTDPLEGLHRMHTITPVLLPPGQYSVVAMGYNNNERNGNAGFSGYPATITNNNGNAIAFVGGARAGGVSFSYPSSADGGPASRYHAGTFSYSTGAGSGTGTPVTLTVTDIHGNVSTGTAKVTVKDNIAPVITCPGNISVIATSAAGSTVTYIAPVGTDNCSVTTVRTAGLASGSTFPIGVTTVTHKATDASGNIAECSFTVTVTGLAPQIVCPANITVNATTGQCGTNVPFAATETTAIPASTISYKENNVTVTPGSFFSVGTHTITATATNPVGSSSCSFTITVVDNQFPVLVGVPANVTVECDAVPAAAVVTATDNCSTSVPTFTETRTNGNCPSNYVLTRTWSTTDASNNTTTKSQIITVQDTQAPILSAAPADVTVNCDAIPAVAVLTATDNCDASPVVTFAQTSSQSADLSNVAHYNYTITRVWTATDACNNASSKTQIITVQDITKPIITAPSSVTVNCQDDNTRASNGDATATDNCADAANIAITQSDVSTYSADPSNVNHYNYVITRTWRATDVAGNFSEAVQTITVHDVTKPVITVPASVTVNCQDDNTSASNGVATATDNCADASNIAITQSDVSTYSTDPSSVNHYNYTITRTWRATDVAGNYSEDVQTITVHDVTKPVITVPASVTVNCQDDNTSASNGVATATDNCADASNIAITQSDVSTYSADPSSVNHYNYTITRTWRATDVAGNYSEDVQTITVHDVTKPVITVPSSVTVNCQDDNTSASNGVATATDNCADASNIAITQSDVSTYSTDPSSVNHYNYTITRTWRATDVAGNYSEDVQTITVQDVTKPIITFTPANVLTINDAGVCGAIVNFAATASDICAPVTITYSKNPGTIFPVGATVVTVTAADVTGNAITSTFEVTITDNEKPTIVTVDKTQNNDAGDCGAVVSVPVPVTGDNCQVATLVNDYNNSSDASGHYPVGTTVINWIVTDIHGNSNTASQTLIVIDNEKPRIKAPRAYSVPNDLGECGATIPSIGTPFTSDNCGVFTVTNDHPSTYYPVGTTIVTWTVIDIHGNKTDTATQSIRVIDNELPKINVSNISVNSDLNVCGATIIPTAPVTSDNCGVAMVVSDHPSNFYPVGTTLVTWTVTDVHGWKASATQTITVTDLQAPTVITKNITVNLDGTGKVSIAASDVDNGSNDACGIKTMAVLPNQFSCNNIGNNTVTLTVTDVNGNVSYKTAVVTVQDKLGPVPTLTSLPTVTGQCSAKLLLAYNWGNWFRWDDDDDDDSYFGYYLMNIPTAMDNCSGLIYGTTTDPLNYYNQGTYTIHWKFTDKYGNTTIQEQTVIVKDNIAPKPWLTSLPTITGQCSVDLSNGYDGDDDEYEEDHDDDHEGDNDHDHWNKHHSAAPWAWDNCAGWIRGTTTDPLTYTTQGTYVIHWSFNDGHGNRTIQNQTVIVKDVTAPKPMVNNLPTITGQCSVTVTTVPTAKDNCAGIITATTTSPLTYITQGTYTIVWKYTDGNGNTSTQTQKVVVDDVTKPVPQVATLPTITAECSATVTVVPKANDNCAGVIVGTTTDPLTYSKEGTYTIRWSYNDGNGNIATQNQTVVINDVTAPVPQVASLPTITAECSATVTAPKANDNCAGVITGTSGDAVTYNKQGTYTIRWIYNDGNGNTSAQNQTVIIKDVTAPVVSVPANATINCGTSANPSATGTASATDNCSGNISITYSDVTFGNKITRTWKATDAAGNYSTGVQTITSVDNTNPVIADVKDVTVNCGSSTDPSATGIAKATDNCSTPIVSYSDITSGYSITRTWKATDASGNSSTSVQIITIVDNTKPVISDIADVTVNCGESTEPSATGTPTASDGCSSVKISKTDVTNGNVITRTWKATDASGNFATSTQIITIGSPFSVTVSSVPTNSTYTGGVSTNLYVGYGAQSTTLTLGSLPSSGAPYTYAWSGSGLSSTTVASPVFTPSTGGSFTLNVTVTNKYGCKAGASISICVNNIIVPGSNGTKIYVCHTPKTKNAASQTLEVLISQVASHLNNGCGGNGSDRLGTCDQAPCTPVVNTSAAPIITNISKQAETTIATAEEELKVTVMPNPSTTYFTLKLESKYETPISMRVMDGRGRVVDAKSKIGANSTIQIGHNYSSGTYYAELIQGTKRKVVQLIKARG